MLGLYLLVPLALGQILGSLHRLLRFHREFIKLHSRCSFIRRKINKKTVPALYCKYRKFAPSSCQGDYVKLLTEQNRA